MQKVLAVSSSGGHWDELILLGPAFVDFEVVYATTLPSQAQRDGVNAYRIADCHRNSRLAALRTGWDLLKLVVRKWPAVVVSTGATPGLLAVAIGKMFGARTVWIDSIANADELSMSGRLARHFVDLHLTQWPHLADGEATHYLGSVL